MPIKRRHAVRSDVRTEHPEEGCARTRLHICRGVGARGTRYGAPSAFGSGGWRISGQSGDSARAARFLDSNGIRVGCTGRTHPLVPPLNTQVKLFEAKDAA